MKRRDLLNTLREIANRKCPDLAITEGGNHTKARIGTRTQVVPRRIEINEITARNIIKSLEESQ